MGIEDSNAPPKKKLKQAQLSFGNITPRSKRKLSSEPTIEDGQAVKIVCKESITNHLVNKENLELNNKIVETIDVDEISDEPYLSEEIKNEKSDEKTKVSQNLAVGEDCKEDNVQQEEKVIILDEVETTETDPLQLSYEEPPTNKSSPIADNSKIEMEVENESPASNSDRGNESKTDSLELSLNISGCSEEDELTTSNTTSPVTPKGKNKLKPLTPKQKLFLEKRQEKERLKKEKEEERAKLKEERLKKKLEKEDLKRKEREEKEKKRLEELRVKEEEKRLKEEERKQKEEEKKRKEDERRKKEEAKEEERRKKEEAKLLEEKKELQAKMAFTNFFISKKIKTINVDDTDNEEQEENLKFMPFPVKPDMRLAGERRSNLSNKDKQRLDEALTSEAVVDKDNLYINELRNGKHIPLKTEPTWPLSEEQHDCIIIESLGENSAMDVDEEKVQDETKRKGHRAKLFQFHENRRPPYWGTWRKMSSIIKPRKPTNKDDTFFDYEVDSDSEWEDEGEGEDLAEACDSDKEPSDDENVGENGYVLDNTFVPHGYLSDEEADDEENFDPEDQKLRMKVLKQEFDEEMKLKAQKLKPRLLGCVWINNDTEVSSGSLYETLMNLRAVWDEEIGSIEVSGPVEEENPSASTPSGAKSKKFLPEVMEALVKFVHGSSLPRVQIIKEFLAVAEKDYPTANISKNALNLKLREIATKNYGIGLKAVWEVNADICTEFGLKSLEKPTPPVAPAPIVEKPKDKFLVNFLKRNSTSPQQNLPVKKRVALISLPPEPKKESAPAIPATPPPMKKRIPFITLTPKNSSEGKTHVDTPRPHHPLVRDVLNKSAPETDEKKTNEQEKIEVINLIDD